MGLELGSVVAVEDSGHLVVVVGLFIGPYARRGGSWSPSIGRSGCLLPVSLGSAVSLSSLSASAP